MAAIINTTITDNTGNTAVWALRNMRGNLNHYTVHATGDFGGGTLTLFTNPQGVADAQNVTTHDVSIKDSTGAAISWTGNNSINFECNSDPESPTAFKVILAGATNPSINLKVDNVA